MVVEEKAKDGRQKEIEPKHTVILMEQKDGKEECDHEEVGEIQYKKQSERTFCIRYRFLPRAYLRRDAAQNIRYPYYILSDAKNNPHKTRLCHCF